MAIGLADYQMNFRGLTFGLTPDGLDSLPVGIMTVTGLEDLDIRAGNSTMPRGDGAIPGLHTINSREISLGLAASGASKSQALSDTVAATLAAFSRTQAPQPLYFKLPGMPERFIFARVIGRQVKHETARTFGHRPILVRLAAADPRIYGAEDTNRTLFIYDATGGGTDYGIDYGVDFTVDTSAEVVLNNDGDDNAYPNVRFYGPPTGTLTEVKLTNTTTGDELEITADLLTGQILSADMRRIISADPGTDPYIHLGGSTRYSDWTLPRTPIYLQPGSNLVRFETTGSTTDAVCVVNYRDTWL